MTADSDGKEAARGRPMVVLVARREILVRLRSRVFAGSTIVMVVLIAAGVVIATLLAGRNTATTVAFGGPATALAAPFESAATALGVKVTVVDVPDASTGEAQVHDGTLGVLVTGTPTAPVATVKTSLPAGVQAALDAAAKQQTLGAALAGAGLDPTAVAAEVAATHVVVDSLQPSDPERSEKTFVGLAVGLVLYLSLGLYGSFVANGVVEEKATRMVEIVLATVRPSQLLAGKVIGIGLVGLLQLSIVGAVAFALVTRANLVTIPAFGAATIAGDIAWFVLGFWLYATAGAALASVVSRQEDVNGATAPMSVFLVMSFLLVYVVIADPTSTLSTILSLLPPFAPILMPVRMATGAATPPEIVLAAALTIATAVGLTWLAGRIYANSVLRLGARVRLLDALRGS